MRGPGAAGALLLPIFFGLSACSDDGAGPGSTDTTAPRRIGDLRVVSSDENGVVLAWMATGDDDLAGRATAYDIRYAATPLTTATFGTAARVDYPGLPSPAGAEDGLPVTGLADGSWYFAVRIADEVPNWSELSNVVEGYVGDTEAPSAVDDLLAVADGPTQVRLSWTAPGDDGLEGTAALYDLRRATAPITDANWDTAASLDGLPTPGTPGSAESFVVTGLTSGVTYHFALRTGDDRPNWSPLSNPVSATTGPDLLPPAAVADLAITVTTGRSVTLTWSAPGDDGNDGLAAEYDLRWAAEPIDEFSWESATPVTGLPAPARPGSAETFTVEGLEPLRAYAFALRAADEAGGWSPVSNSAATETGDAWPITRAPEGEGHFVGDPEWSPDGTRIAFSANWGEQDGVWVTPAEGGEPTFVTEVAGGFVFGLSWSPEGTRLAFSARRSLEHLAIWAVDAVEGATPSLVVSHADSIHLGTPDWSPDGTRIAYGAGVFASLFGSAYHIWVVPAGGGTPERLVEAGTDWGVHDVDWAPDGTRLAVMSSRGLSWDLFVVPLAGGGWTQLTFGTLGNPRHANPSWSPDGAWIAYATYTGDGTPDLYLIRPDGSGRTRFTSDPSADSHPTWSPDGTRIAYASDRGGQSEIWVQLVPQ